MEAYQMKSARKVLGMTQKDLAEVLEVKEHTVASWENKRLPIRKVTQLAVLHLLNTSGIAKQSPQ